MLFASLSLVVISDACILVLAAIADDCLPAILFSVESVFIPAIHTDPLTRQSQ